jgi:hypothetical protein
MLTREGAMFERALGGAPVAVPGLEGDEAA